MARGTLFPIERRQHVHGDLSCFESQLSVKEIINPARTPLAHEMLNQVLLQTSVPPNFYYKNDSIVATFIKKEQEIKMRTQQNPSAPPLPPIEPMTVFGKHFFFNENNVIPCMSPTDVRVLCVELRFRVKPQSLSLPPPVPLLAPMCSTRVDLWPVFRLLCELT